jgi:hypothetical protein
LFQEVVTNLIEHARLQYFLESFPDSDVQVLIDGIFVLDHYDWQDVADLGEDLPVG